MRVRPYYLYQCDLVEGAGHFRTPVAAGTPLLRLRAPLAEALIVVPYLRAVIGFETRLATQAEGEATYRTALRAVERRSFARADLGRRLSVRVDSPQGSAVSLSELARVTRTPSIHVPFVLSRSKIPTSPSAPTSTRQCRRETSGTSRQKSAAPMRPMVLTAPGINLNDRG